MGTLICSLMLIVVLVSVGWWLIRVAIVVFVDALRLFAPCSLERILGISGSAGLALLGVAIMLLSLYAGLCTILGEPC